MPVDFKKLPSHNALTKAVIELATMLNDVARWADKEVPSMTAAQATEIYVAMRLIDAALNDAVQYFGRSKLQLNNETIPKAFEREGLKSLTSERLGYRVTVTDAVRAGIRKDKRPAAYQWLRNHGLGSLIVETVNASTLSATAKAMLEEGHELEDALFNVALMKQTSMTKVKPKPKR